MYIDLVRLIIHEANLIGDNCFFCLNKKKLTSYMELLMCLLYENIQLKEIYILNLLMDDYYYNLVIAMNSNYTIHIQCIYII